jgi:hypothetical protein
LTKMDPFQIGVLVRDRGMEYSFAPEQLQPWSWRAMLASFKERDREQILGFGGEALVSISCEPMLSSYDHKRHHAAAVAGRPFDDGVKAPIWDFVVRRDDGVAVRFHPQLTSKKVEIASIAHAPLQEFPKAGPGKSDGPGTYRAYREGAYERVASAAAEAAPARLADAAPERPLPPPQRNREPPHRQDLPPPPLPQTRTRAPPGANQAAIDAVPPPPAQQIRFAATPLPPPAAQQIPAMPRRPAPAPQDYGALINPRLRFPAPQPEPQRQQQPEPQRQQQPEPQWQQQAQGWEERGAWQERPAPAAGPQLEPQQQQQPRRNWEENDAWPEWRQGWRNNDWQRQGQENNEWQEQLQGWEMREDNGRRASWEPRREQAEAQQRQRNHWQ